MFEMDVTKVDRDVAMVVHICCKGMLPMFYLCFLDACCKCVYLDVAYVSHIRCMCFIWMLHFVAMVFKYFQVFFQVFQKHILSVSIAFRVRHSESMEFLIAVTIPAGKPCSASLSCLIQDQQSRLEHTLSHL